MKCIYCEHPESKVVDSRPTDEGTVIRRRRECLKCGKRFTTYEKAEQMPMMVIKKRPVSIEQIDKIVENIEKIIYNSLEREVPSGRIGELVMDELRQLDPVAYVRFASVYRQFTDIDTFKRELEKLLEEK